MFHSYCFIAQTGSVTISGQIEGYCYCHSLSGIKLPGGPRYQNMLASLSAYIHCRYMTNSYQRLFGLGNVRRHYLAKRLTLATGRPHPDLGNDQVGFEGCFGGRYESCNAANEQVKKKTEQLLTLQRALDS